MDNVHKAEKFWSWTGIGEVVLWIVFYFWAVWIFNAFLPARPDRTPVESYLGKQLWERTGATAGAQSAEARELSDETAAEGIRH